VCILYILVWTTSVSGNLGGLNVVGLKIQLAKFFSGVIRSNSSGNLSRLLQAHFIKYISMGHHSVIAILYETLLSK